MSDWNEAPFGSIVSYLGRGQGPTYIDEESGILAINQKCVRDGKVIVKFARYHDPKIQVKDSAVLKNDDICINSTGTGTIGRIGIWTADNSRTYFVDSHVSIARTIEERYHFKFIAYLLQTETIQTKLETYCFSGSTNQIELNREALRNLTLRLPPDVPEQRKIARILSTVDRLIEKTEEMIAKYQSIKAGLMQDLFTRGVDKNGELRPSYEEAPELYKDEPPFGRISKRWKISHLSEIARYQTGKAFPSNDYGEEGIILLRPGNLPKEEYIIWDALHTTQIPESWAEKAKEYLVYDNEIIMNLTAQSLEDHFLGRVCITPTRTRCLLNQRLARFRAIDCQYSFLFWAFKGPHFRFQVDRLTQGTKVQHIYNSNLNSINLPIPEEHLEQERISESLFKIVEHIELEKINLLKLKQIKSGLMQDLLTGRVRVTPDREDEEFGHV